MRPRHFGRISARNLCGHSVGIPTILSSSGLGHELFELQASSRDPPGDFDATSVPHHLVHLHGVEVQRLNRVDFVQWC